jgi:hypothetical protein
VEWNPREAERYNSESDISKTKVSTYISISHTRTAFVSKKTIMNEYIIAKKNNLHPNTSTANIFLLQLWQFYAATMAII